MEIKNNYEFKFVSVGFREVELQDASYILSLRLDPKYNNFISKVSSDLKQQEKYIENYKIYERPQLKSFYFIIERLDDGRRCGTVRVYNIQDTIFEWGSWILDTNKTRYAAMETAIFIYEFAFNKMNYTASRFEVNKDNKRVISFHLKSGAKIINEDETNFYFEISKETALNFVFSLRQRLTKG